jgi:hypothetical protein
MRCAISQPTFLPWLGWFDIVDQSDQMVILDNVQFEKRSWQQRNRIRTPNGLDFITVPVKTSGRYYQTINEVELVDPKFPEKFLKTIKSNYSKAPHYKYVIGELEQVIFSSTESGKLFDMNFGLIKLIAKWLGVDKNFRLASSFLASGKRGEYLAMICSEVGATTYISTPGSEAYLIEEISFFNSRGIKIFLHEYNHPIYKQLHDPFIPQASAIDLIMLYGADSRQIFHAAQRAWRSL